MYEVKGDLLSVFRVLENGTILCSGGINRYTLRSRIEGRRFYLFLTHQSGS